MSTERHFEETTLRSHVDLPLTVDRTGDVPMAAQLAGQLRDAMLTGMLKAGERVPSSRRLAASLGVSRTVVTEAYQQLYAEGWLDGRHGSGTYVADVTAIAPGGDARPREHPAGSTRSLGKREAPPYDGEWIDLRPGRAWTLGIDEAAWRRAWRRAGAAPPVDDPDPFGLPELREQLARHLRRARAVPAGPGGILVTRGTGNGLDLVAATLLRPGDRVGVEEPGYRGARNVFAARGAEVVPCPVDEHGVVADGLPGDLRLIYTTPAHQFPLGGRLPITRRERLIAWARRTGAMIVEDDYDAEFRYDVAPLPALYGLDPARVILLGTLSKSLAADVGVGWLVAEPALLERVARRREDLGDRTPGPVQAAVAALLDSGDLDRHLRRMRQEYARRRAVVVELLGEICPPSRAHAAGEGAPGGDAQGAWRLRGDTAGLHVSVELPAPVVGPLVAAARRRGVLLDVIERNYGSAAGPRVHGLVIGYGSASKAQIAKACRVVADLLAEARRDARRAGRVMNGERVVGVERTAPGMAGEPGPPGLAQEASEVRSLP